MKFRLITYFTSIFWVTFYWKHLYCTEWYYESLFKIFYIDLLIYFWISSSKSVGCRVLARHFYDKVLYWLFFEHCEILSNGLNCIVITLLWKVYLQYSFLYKNPWNCISLHRGSLLIQIQILKSIVRLHFAVIGLVLMG